MDIGMIVMMVVWIGFAIFSSVIFVEGRRKLMFTIYAAGGIMFSIIAFSDIIFIYMSYINYLSEFWVWLSMLAASFIPIVLLMFFIMLIYGRYRVMEYFHTFAIFYIVFYILPSILVSVKTHENIIKNSIFLGLSNTFSFYDMFWITVFLFVLLIGWRSVRKRDDEEKKHFIIIVTIITFINIIIIASVYFFHFNYVFKWIDYFLSYVFFGYITIRYDIKNKKVSVLHDRIFETLPIGIIVFDDYKELIKINDVATRVLDNNRISMDTVKDMLKEEGIIKLSRNNSSLYFEIYKYEGNYVVIIKDEAEELLPEIFVEKYDRVYNLAKEDKMTDIMRFLEDYGIEGVYWERIFIDRYSLVASDNSFNVPLLGKDVDTRYKYLLDKTGEFFFTRGDEKFNEIKKSSVKGNNLYVISWGQGHFRVFVSFVFNTYTQLTKRQKIIISIVFHLIIENYLKKELR